MTGKDSMWVQWIHGHKLNGRSFWEVPLRSNVTWGWRTILNIRQLIRPHIISRIGNGSSISAWFDTWDTAGPLSHIVTSRDIFDAGFNLNTKVAGIVQNGDCVWPNSWYAKYPLLATVHPPDLSYSPDSIWVRHKDMYVSFSVAIIWDIIRPRGNEVKWYNIVWFSHCIPRHAIHMWLVMQRKL